MSPRAMHVAKHGIIFAHLNTILSKPAPLNSYKLHKTLFIEKQRYLLAGWSQCEISPGWERPHKKTHTCDWVNKYLSKQKHSGEALQSLSGTDNEDKRDQSKLSPPSRSEKEQVRTQSHAESPSERWKHRVPLRCEATSGHAGISKV